MQNETGETRDRKIPDRRKRPTPFISRYSFIGGRRKTIRREEDKKKHVFVDLYSTRLFIILLILSALSIVDSYFTLSLIKGNLAVEINPVMTFFLEQGSAPFVFTKFLFTTIPLFILCICKNRPTTRVLVISAVVIYLFVIIMALFLLAWRYIMHSGVQRNWKPEQSKMPGLHAFAVEFLPAVLKGEAHEAKRSVASSCGLLARASRAWMGLVRQGRPASSTDSITVLHDGRGEQIRLYGIDCPEKNQDFGTKAKQGTSNLVFAKVVEVEPVSVDRYGRTVPFVRVGDALVNEELMQQGLAWVFARYCDRPICKGLERKL